MNSRDLVLGRIRAALGRPSGIPADALARAEAHLAARPVGPQSSWTDIPVERFRARAKALASTAEAIASLAEAPSAVARYLNALNLPLQAVCWPSLASLGWAAAGLAVETRPATGEDLVGITGCFCAVADTGTLMLVSGPGTPAATSLLPETHIALVPVSRIVPQMEDGWRLLRMECGRLPRAVNFVSGPSRTADIEQTVTLGAHGPYRVHLLLVEGS